MDSQSSGGWINSLHHGSFSNPVEWHLVSCLKGPSVEGETERLCGEESWQTCHHLVVKGNMTHDSMLTAQTLDAVW